MSFICYSLFALKIIYVSIFFVTYFVHLFISLMLLSDMWIKFGQSAFPILLKPF